MASRRYVVLKNMLSFLWTDHTCDENDVIMESTPCVFDDWDGGEENPCILIVTMKALYDHGDEVNDYYFPPQNILGAYTASWLLRRNWHDVFEYHQSSIALTSFHNLDLCSDFDEIYVAISFCYCIMFMMFNKRSWEFRTPVKWGAREGFWLRLCSWFFEGDERWWKREGIKLFAIVVEVPIWFTSWMTEENIGSEWSWRIKIADRTCTTVKDLLPMFSSLAPTLISCLESYSWRLLRCKNV